MANVKISQLTSASSLAGTEVLPVVQGGTTKKVTVQSIADLAGGGSAPISFNIIADGTVVQNNSNVSIIQKAVVTTVSGNQTVVADTYPEVYLGGGTSSATTITIENLPAASLALNNASNLLSLSLPDFTTIKFGGMIAFSVNNCSSLTTISVPALTTIPGNIWLDFSNNALSENTVNDLLVKFVATGATNNSLYLQGGTNATPTGLGSDAKAILLTRGWSISNN